LVAQIENITEKLESQYKFQNLVENFIVGVYIIQDDKLVYVNPHIMHELGYEEDEITNEPFEKFIFEDDVELVREKARDRINKETQSIRYEARMIRKDGQPVWYEILGGTTLYNGAPALIGTMVNITERQNYINAIEAQNERLREISWIQSHIVRAPLSRMMALIPILENLSDTVEERKKIMDYISTSAYELDEVIRNISDKSKIEDFYALKSNKKGIIL
jgi:PAS domain S-box-containing protein